MQRRLWRQLRMREKLGFEMAFKCLRVTQDLMSAGRENSVITRYCSVLSVKPTLTIAVTVLWWSGNIVCVLYSTTWRCWAVCWCFHWSWPVCWVSVMTGSLRARSWAQRYSSLVLPHCSSVSSAVGESTKLYFLLNCLTTSVLSVFNTKPRDWLRRTSLMRLI